MSAKPGHDADEQSFVKLPDGSILTVDGGNTSQRYIPALNQWVNDGTLPVNLFSAGELGPAFLLPNGKVIYLGADSYTAIYTPSGSSKPGTWTRGPDIPWGDGEFDAPAAMMADGNILCSIGPQNFTGNSTLVVYNYRTNSFESVESGPSFLGFSIANGTQNFPGVNYHNHMLDVPDGGVLFGQGYSQLYEFKPAGAPVTSGQPVVKSIVSQPDGSYLLTGTGLNGISQGAAYGDDAQMDSNYPVIRLVGPTGTVTYADTYNWSLTGVMTGKTLETVSFRLPAGVTPAGVTPAGVTPAGVTLAGSTLYVTANGIASPGYVQPAITSSPSSLAKNAGQTVTLTAKATGTPAPTVQWQVSTDDGKTFTNVEGATSTTLSFTASPADNGAEFQAVFTNPAGSVASDIATVTVMSPPAVTVQPMSQLVAAGNTATFMVAATANPAASVQWQISTDHGHSFTPVTGATSTSYTTPTLDSTYNGDEYRAVFTGGTVTAATKAATLTVGTAPQITLDVPTTLTVNAGAAVTLKTTVSGAPAPKIEWQVSTNGGQSFSPVAGATSSTLAFKAKVSTSLEAGAVYTYIYQALATNALGQVATDQVTVTVNFAPVVLVDPSEGGAVANGSASFLAAADSNPAASEQWQISTDHGKTFTDIAGATGLSYKTPGVTAADTGNLYRAVFTNSVGTATSKAAGLVIGTVPVITQDLSPLTVTAGQEVTFTIVASGSPPPTFLWMMSTDGGKTETMIKGETKPTFSFKATTSDNGNIYDARLVNAVDRMGVETKHVMLTVDYAPTITLQPTNQAAIAGSTATFTAEASANPAATGVQWYVSTDGGKTFSPAPGTATFTTNGVVATSRYTTGAASATQNDPQFAANGTQFRAVFTRTIGGTTQTATTKAAVLSIDVPPTITAQPVNEALRAGQTVTFTAAASGTPSPTVQWQVSTDGGKTFTDIQGATSATLKFTATASQNGFMYRPVFSNPVGSDITGDPASLVIW